MRLGSEPVAEGRLRLRVLNGEAGTLQAFAIDFGVASTPERLANLS